MNPMRGIAFKIFLSFWLIFAVLIASFALLPDRGVDPRFRDHLRLAAHTAVALLERHGRDQCASFAAALEESAQMTFRLADAAGRVVCSSPTPPAGDGTLVLHVDATRGSGAFQATAAAGAAFAATRGRPDFPYRAVGLTILVSGVVCFAMARYLAGPLQRIRDASRRLAGGDLQARAGDSVSGRHDEIGDLVRDFDAMAERIGYLVRSQTQLLTDISHELRSPLARLNIALELARRRTAGESAELDRIETEASRMNDLIGRLLALARAESGVWEDLDDVDVGAVVRQVTDDADYEAQRHNKSVDLCISGKPVIAGDPALISSAIDNVVRNALRYTPEDTTVYVALQESGDSVTISVRDFGPGVPASELDRIFSPFHRAERAPADAHSGLGLGLAIAKRAVAFHGGTIRAALHPDGGLVVTIDLPARAAATRAKAFAH